MKRLRNLVSMAIILATASACLAQAAQDADLAHQFQVRVTNLTLQQFSTDKLVIGVGLAANATRNVTIDELVLSGLRLNGVPLYAAPIKHRFKLRSDKSANLPEQLKVTIYLRDLDSLTPLRDAISKGYATLNGVAMVHVPLNPLERLMLLSSHAEVSTTVHQQVAFNIPGGPFAAASLVKMLDLADSVFKAVDSTITGATGLGRR